MGFGDLLREHQRLILLRVLAAQPRYRANDSYLKGVLDAFGLPAGHDQVRALIAWLEGQGLVAVELAADSWVPRATETGLDVAAGRLTLPGVQRPGPGADTAAQAVAAAVGTPPPVRGG